MSLRRPTVACSSFIFCYKPFMWCRPDARLRHYYSCSFLSWSHSDPRLAPALSFLQFPLEQSFRPSFGTGIIILAVSSRGAIQTLVWHRHYYCGIVNLFATFRGVMLDTRSVHFFYFRIARPHFLYTRASQIFVYFMADSSS